MNRKMVLNLLGKIVSVVALLMLLPLFVSLIYREFTVALSFAVTVIGALLVGGAAVFFTRGADKTIFAREGFIVVAFAWILASLVGALPFTLSGEIPSYVDAFFETVSGFTTTGSSILVDVEAMSHGLLFWRSFTHWIGGMGILVLVLAIIPDRSGRLIHIMRAEMPGPTVDKIVPKVRETAKIFYLIYMAMTAVLVVLLLLGGMPLFDSLLHAFGTAGTGGFGIKADGLASYSPYIQWVITIFMLIFGVNFNLYFLLIFRKSISALKSEELWTYIGIVLSATGLITYNIIGMYDSFGEALRHSAFQVSSIITTTGYATCNFDLWPELSRAILFLLLFIGGCAGSTAGGLKVSRAVMLVKSVRREVSIMLHPRSVKSVKFEGKVLDGHARSRVVTYFALYSIIIAAVFLIVSFEPFDFVTNLSATVTCFNNVGPGLAMVGPAGNFSEYSDFAKIVLSAAMLLGRLEIYPILVALAPSNWIKK